MTLDGSSGWDGGSEGGEGGEGGEGSGAGGGASCWMVTSVKVQAELQNKVHEARTCGGEDESLEMWYAQAPQLFFPSRSLSAIVLGSSPSNNQRGSPTLPSSPSQSGSQ